MKFRQALRRTKGRIVSDENGDIPRIDSFFSLTDSAPILQKRTNAMVYKKAYI